MSAARMRAPVCALVANEPIPGTLKSESQDSDEARLPEPEPENGREKCKHDRKSRKRGKKGNRLLRHFWQALNSKSYRQHLQSTSLKPTVTSCMEASANDRPV